MKIQELKEAAKDLNKVVGCEPPIDMNGDKEVLIASLMEAAELVVPTDKLRPVTRRVIDQLIKKGKKGGSC